MMIETTHLNNHSPCVVALEMITKKALRNSIVIIQLLVVGIIIFAVKIGVGVAHTKCAENMWC